MRKFIILISVFLFFLIACDEENKFPIAVFILSQMEGSAPLEVNMDASGSYDPDGNITAWSWDFGDGESGSGVEVVHTFQSEGVYTITLTVTDNTGATDIETAVVTVTRNEITRLFSSVKYWAYQLQGMEEGDSVSQLVNSRYDLLVLEPLCTDWSYDEAKKFDTAGMVSKIKASKANNGTDRKLVMAYVNIAEAEDWRWYWVENNWPAWNQGKPRPAGLPEYILKQDPDGWSGNFPVAYWDEEWQDIIIYGENTGTNPDRDYKSAIDEIIQDGFDGVFMDWVAAFEDDSVIAAAKAAGVNPEEEMIKLIQRIHDYAQERKPGFIVIQQNGSALLEGRSHLLNYIDGISQEGIWYWGEADVGWNNPKGYDIATEAALTVWYIQNLDKFLTAGVKVLCCDYTVKHAAATYQKALDKGYIGYCARASLDRLTGTPPPRY
ncbi:MAG: endo alpha-1,4 polygalactosaminidase [Acidobacteria bacterium]|nr:endo alpha-1,4 polygalactosaminidase [Acidobacteriota bacterium]